MKMPRLQALPVLIGLIAPCLVLARGDVRMHCDVTYAGQTQRIDIVRTQDVYRVPSVSIGGRFAFKALQVQAAQQAERVALYVYRQDDDRAVLIQHLELAPVPMPSGNTPLDLVGRQHLYSGPLERELIYQCFAQAVQP